MSVCTNKAPSLCLYVCLYKQRLGVFANGFKRRRQAAAINLETNPISTDAPGGVSLCSCHPCNLLRVILILTDDPGGIPPPKGSSGRPPFAHVILAQRPC